MWYGLRQTGLFAGWLSGGLLFSLRGKQVSLDFLLEGFLAAASGLCATLLIKNPLSQTKQHNLGRVRIYFKDSLCGYSHCGTMDERLVLESVFGFAEFLYQFFTTCPLGKFCPVAGMCPGAVSDKSAGNFPIYGSCTCLIFHN